MAVISAATLPMCQASTCGRVLARARVQDKLQVLQNSGSRMLVLRLCQREIATDEIQERKNYRERSNIEARVSVQ